MKKKYQKKLFSWLLFAIFLLFCLCSLVFSEIEISGKIDPLLSGTYNSLYASEKIKRISLDSSFIEVTLPFEKLSSTMALDWINGEPMVGAFIKVEGSIDELQSLGARIHSRIGNIVTADIPLVKLSPSAEM